VVFIELVNCVDNFFLFIFWFDNYRFNFLFYPYYFSIFCLKIIDKRFEIVYKKVLKIYQYANNMQLLIILYNDGTKWVTTAIFP